VGVWSESRGRKVAVPILWSEVWLWCKRFEVAQE
jgi:hypothetical protein